MRLRHIEAMKFASAISTQSEWEAAVAEACGQIELVFHGHQCDLVLLFVHVSFAAQAREIQESLLLGLRPRHLIGCTGAGIIGGTNEVEQKPAISVLAAELPGAGLTPFHVMQSALEEATGPSSWHFELRLPGTETPGLILFVDPFTLQSTVLVQALAEAYPGATMVGGLASGGLKPGVNRFFLDGDTHENGAVGLGLTGAVEMRALIAQGCKPIGDPFTITRAEKNIILELAGRPPLTVLQEMLPHLSKGDQQLAQKALVLGRVINEYREEHRRGDFLIRNLIGHDPQSGALAVGDWVHPGQTVQFQVRDGACADQDLRDVLAEGKQSLSSPPQGALLFSCLGRGEGMYGVRGHDVRLLQEYFGPIPTAGFFCNGEIGPVAGGTFVHGFTSVVGLFAPKTGRDDG